MYFDNHREATGRETKMRKVFFVFLGVWILFWANPARGETFDTFRGIKWGEDRKAVSGLLAGPQRAGVEVYTREEKKIVGDIEVENIYYLFYREKLGAAMITFGGASNFATLKEALREKYGPAEKPEPLTEKYVWDLMDLKIILHFLEEKGSGSIDYFFKPIAQQREDDKSKAKRKENQKRISDL
jgi:hypothetical protein